MFCAACDNPTTELFGDFRNLCGTCDELEVFVPVSYVDNEFGFDDDEDIMCDLAFENDHDFDDGRFEFQEGFHECY